MRVIIQRVKSASVSVNNQVCGQINQGYTLLVGFTQTDTEADYDWMANKILSIRLFNDDNQVMNLNVQEVTGELLVVSQFTLYANTAKGNRPSYIRATKPTEANTQYQNFITILKSKTKLKIEEGIFGANMQITLVNDGPVTLMLDSNQKDF